MKVSHRLLIIAALFVTCFITANIISVKMISLGPFIVFAGVFVFPFSYIFGDVLTEVYGYRIARRVIWLGFACNLIFVIFAWVGQVMPAPSGWELQEAYESILGYTPRLLFASVCGYLAGEFANSYILAKMKIFTRGRWLWSRTIGSTIIGEGLDTVVFTVLALIGTPFFLPLVMLSQWLVKVVVEIAATPATYAVVGYLKRKEGVDSYDRRTNFNPFRVLD
ncbi:MAG: queuosine precursor transporter [Chloroflexi bacterium]|nr:queuosine precursor transporter [Chloroflexota bacterium]